MANLKFQNMESVICDVKFQALARTSCSRLAPPSLFNCGIRVKDCATLPNQQCEIFLRNAAQDVGDSESKVGIARGEWNSRDQDKITVYSS
jgi:hypothetical protein